MAAIRVAMCYRTVFDMATLVLADMPLHIFCGQTTKDECQTASDSKHGDFLDKKRESGNVGAVAGPLAQLPQGFVDEVVDTQRP